jgi:hypothetical protein
MESMDSTTITVSARTRRELLRVAGELQLRSGKKIDYEDVIRYLLARSTKDERLLLQAVRPSGRSSAEIQEALRQGRSEDRRGEEELEHRYT